MIEMEIQPRKPVSTQVDWFNPYLFQHILTAVRTTRGWRPAITWLQERFPASDGHPGQYDRLREPNLRRWFKEGSYTELTPKAMGFLEQVSALSFLGSRIPEDFDDVKPVMVQSLIRIMVADESACLALFRKHPSLL